MVKFSRGVLVLLLLSATASQANAADPAVLAAQQKRISVVEKVAPSVVAIFAPGGGGGGSGVIISPDGYALSNFHVTSAAGNFMKCGLNDGVLYDAVIVGIDPTGDVALLKILGRDDFPTAKLGDSDTVKVGDWAYAMGNPFLLATDFQPTVTYGVVSGVQRYQYPAGNSFLEYTDCIQVDSSINPGNSGGPLFNDEGELIGINGRGSFEKRGRVNSGAGYAISINQIKHFMDHLRSGRIVDHATLGATVTTDDRGRVIVANILEESEAYRRGLRMDDEIVSFGGRNIGSVNQFKNVLGIYPKGWKVPLTYRRADQKYEIYVTLRALHTAQELAAFAGGGQQGTPRPQRQPKEKDPDGETPDAPKGQPGGEPRLPQGHPPIGQKEKIPEELARFYMKKDGFTNYYFNELEQQRVLKAFERLGDFSGHRGTWKLTGKLEEGPAYEIKLGNALIGMTLADKSFGGSDVYVQELGDLVDLKDEPPGTGGLLVAMHHLRLMLAFGPKQFSAFYYLGSEPLDGRGEKVDVLVAELSGAESHWYVHPQQGLVGFDLFRSSDAEACEIRFEGTANFEAVKLPEKLHIHSGGLPVAVLSLESFSAGSDAAAAKADAPEPKAADDSSDKNNK